MTKQTTEPNIFQEIEADIERQRLEDLWKRVGPFVISAAIIVMVITGGYSAWHSWQTNKVQTATSQFMALATDTTADEASFIASLEKFAQANAATTQGALALFQAAAIAAKQGNTQSAISYYNGIAANTKIDASFRQLADLYSIELQADTGNTAELLKKLEPLTKSEAPFHFSALELSGYMNMKLGEKAKARQIFSALANDASAPHGISTRATTMLRYLGE